MPERDDIDVSTLLQAQRELLLGTAPAVGAQALQAGGETGQEDNFVSIKHYAYLVYGRKWWVLMATFLVAAFAAVYTWMRPRVYEASHAVVLSEGADRTSDLFSGRPVYYDPEVLALMAEAKPVAHLANRIYVRNLEELQKQTARQLEPNEERELETALENARQAAEVGVEDVAPLGAPRIEKHQVVFTARREVKGSRRVGKAIVASIAKSRAEALVEHFMASTGGLGRVRMLKSLVAANDKAMEDASARLAKMLGDRPQGMLSSNVLERLNHIQQLKRALMDVDLRVKETEQQISTLRKIVQKAELQPDFKTRARLLQLRAELTEMSKRYRDGHPKYKQKLAEINTLEALIEAEKDRTPAGNPLGDPVVVRELRRTEVDLDGLKRRRKELEGNIARETKLLEGKGSERILAHEKLIREQRALEQMGDRLRQKLREAEIATQVRGDGVALPVSLGRAGAPAQVGANAFQTVGFALILGLVMGVLLALLLEHLDDTVRTEVSVRRVSGMPVLARLPRFASGTEQRFISPDAPRSDTAETFKFFHNHVRYAGPDVPEKCLQVTSPNPEDGKTYVAVNLALSFASEGNRVCFVDADLRRSRTEEILDVLRPRGETDIGLCGYLEGSLSFDDVILESEIENLCMVLAGGRAANPPRLLRSESMHALLERLQADFDVVIVDSPPVIPVVDSAIISSMARATLMVVRYGVTHEADLAESADRMTHVNAPLVGVVINGMQGGGAGYRYRPYRYRHRYGTY